MRTTLNLILIVLGVLISAMVPSGRSPSPKRLPAQPLEASRRAPSVFGSRDEGLDRSTLPCRHRVLASTWPPLGASVARIPFEDVAVIRQRWVRTALQPCQAITPATEKRAFKRRAYVQDRRLPVLPLRQGNSRCAPIVHTSGGCLRRGSALPCLRTFQPAF